MKTLKKQREEKIWYRIIFMGTDIMHCMTYHQMIQFRMSKPSFCPCAPVIKIVFYIIIYLQTAFFNASCSLTAAKRLTSSSVQ